MKRIFAIATREGPSFPQTRPLFENGRSPLARLPFLETTETTTDSVRHRTGRLESKRTDRIWRVRDYGLALHMNWQGELKYCSSRCICLRPQLSSVSFNDRTADGQPHSQSLGLGRIKGLKEPVNNLRIQSRT